MSDTTDRIDKRLDQIKAVGWLLSAASEVPDSVPDAAFIDGASVIADLADALRVDFDELRNAAQEHTHE